MASPNNPKSSAQLIHEYSHARYLTVNNGSGFDRVNNSKAGGVVLVGKARAQLAHKYR